jgi:hypothetical protein
MIMTRTGETLIVKTNQGNVTVVLTDSTKTKDDTGVFGLGTDTMSSVVLIPGLKVDVDGTSDDQGRVVAKTITVDGDDLETSEMIQSGLHPTAQQVAANLEAIAANKQNVSANKQDISANKQDISANREQIEALKGQAAAHKEVTACRHTQSKATSRSSAEFPRTGRSNWEVVSSLPRTCILTCRQGASDSRLEPGCFPSDG